LIKAAEGPYQKRGAFEENIGSRKKKGLWIGKKMYSPPSVKRIAGYDRPRGQRGGILEKKTISPRTVDESQSRSK